MLERENLADASDFCRYYPSNNTTMPAPTYPAGTGAMPSATKPATYTGAAVANVAGGAFAGVAALVAFFL